MLLIPRVQAITLAAAARIFQMPEHLEFSMSED